MRAHADIAAFALLAPAVIARSSDAVRAVREPGGDTEAAERHLVEGLLACAAGPTAP